jgi:hypothetical protein
VPQRRGERSSLRRGDNALAALRRRRSVESRDSASSVTVSLVTSAPAPAAEANPDLLISTLLQSQAPLSSRSAEQKEEIPDNARETVKPDSAEAEKGGQHQGHVQDEYSDED